MSVTKYVSKNTFDPKDYGQVCLKEKIAPFLLYILSDLLNGNIEYSTMWNDFNYNFSIDGGYYSIVVSLSFHGFMSDDFVKLLLKILEFEEYGDGDTGLGTLKTWFDERFSYPYNYYITPLTPFKITVLVRHITSEEFTGEFSEDVDNLINSKIVNIRKTFKLDECVICMTN